MIAPWYIQNEVIQRGLTLKTVEDELHSFSVNSRKRPKQSLKKHLVINNNSASGVQRYTYFHMLDH